VANPVAGHPFEQLVDRLPPSVRPRGRQAGVRARRCEELLGLPGDRYVEEPLRWENDSAGLHRITATVDEDGGRRVYGVLVADDPARDATTALPGRGLLLEHLRLACMRARQTDGRVALLHVSLDGLDLVSAGLGRAAHDAVFREVAGRIRATVAETALVASLGDGELAVMLADLDGGAPQVAETAAGQVMVAAGRPLAVGEDEFELSARVGVSLHPGDAADAEALVRHAEAAVREARRTDGVRMLFYDGGTSEALERLLITARLRRAVEHDELVLHYQPMFRLAGEREIAGVEALLRWEDPSRGLVPPLDFVPVAEYTGLIEPIGRWVVERCCRQAAAWRDAGIAVPVSFNVSPRQFRDPAFVERLGETIAAHALDPGLLMVEITESMAMRDPTCVEPILTALRTLGVRLAIDDFGAGHSSLSRLRDLEVDVLKIDRSFLQRAPDDSRATKLVHAALDLVDALDMTPVAEGVETEQQRTLLADRGCALAQGFHLARPLPADEMTKLLHASRR
jgi:diguanylate cyclase (GGDEF)-like protein